MQAPGLVGELYVWYKDWWLKKSDGEKATLILMAMNAVPFLLWKAPNAHIRIFMTKNFLDYPGRSPGYTLLTSVFSHKDFMHIAFNMVGLYSFGPPAFNYFQQSQLARFTSNPNNESLKPPHTTNLYSNISLFLTFGVLANLLPHYASQLAIRSPLLMRSSAAQALIPRPGLGASGAVYSMLVVSAMAYPKMAVSLIFLPMVPISIGYAVPGMCLVDAVGILRGWHSFGHLTHLTGAGVGYLSVQRNRWKNSQVGIAR
ncbi:hypothetical protein EJ08DRAFT_579224 [Tothia fuscella]|uniref:Peptidase S54 rhomboid domain-containing protein n=1 Tax=Tothia fuscella TaxID=1048955 RepID=A0A9P4P2I9_9PEZI|nr:hypothetical protein EJ08DRAFT_579224 [Tothia fuscella]